MRVGIADRQREGGDAQQLGELSDGVSRVPIDDASRVAPPGSAAPAPGAGDLSGAPSTNLADAGEATSVEAGNKNPLTISVAARGPLSLACRATERSGRCAAPDAIALL